MFANPVGVVNRRRCTLERPGQQGKPVFTWNLLDVKQVKWQSP